MYYRDQTGCGCLLLLLILFTVIIALLLNPYFWIAVGVLFVVSLVRRMMASAQRGPEQGEEVYEGRTSAGNYRSGEPAELGDYESGAVDVEVEVVSEEDADQ